MGFQELIHDHDANVSQPGMPAGGQEERLYLKAKLKASCCMLELDLITSNPNSSNPNDY